MTAKVNDTYYSGRPWDIGTSGMTLDMLDFLWSYSAGQVAYSIMQLSIEERRVFVTRWYLHCLDCDHIFAHPGAAFDALCRVILADIPDGGCDPILSPLWRYAIEQAWSAWIADDTGTQRAFLRAAHQLHTGAARIQAAESGVYFIGSASRSTALYRTTSYWCTCEAARGGKMCWHRAAADIVTALHAPPSPPLGLAELLNALADSSFV